MTAEGSWYYAKNNTKHGPVSNAQLKSLAADGQLQPTDLVWKEGMEEWKPAGRVAGLFSDSSGSAVTSPTPASAASPSLPSSPSFSGVVPADPLRVSRNPSDRGFDLMQFGKPIGPPLLLIGIMVVVMAKGCDSVGLRGMSKINSDHHAVERKLNDRDLDADEKEDLQDKEKRLRKSVENAGANFRTFSYYREWGFLLGTVLLVFGLVATGFTADGAARWICLIMLAIITFSIYVGGIAWLGSLASLIPDQLF